MREGLDLEKCEIPSLQQYERLQRPKKTSITYLTLASSFSMRLNFFIKCTSWAKIWSWWWWCIYIGFYCALLHTQSALQSCGVGGGGLFSTTASVQHPLGWCNGCHRTTAPAPSPHTSYRWRGERVIEPIKWMGIISCTCLRCLCVKGFPFVVIVERGFLALPCRALPCPALPSMPAVLFFPYGVVFVAVLFYFLLSK